MNRAIKILLLVVALGCGVGAKGQNIFQQRSLLTNKMFVDYHLVFPSDTAFLAMGWGRTNINDTTISAERIFLSWYNWNGDLIQTKDFYLGDTSGIYAMWHGGNPIINTGGGL